MLQCTASVCSDWGTYLINCSPSNDVGNRQRGERGGMYQYNFWKKILTGPISQDIAGFPFDFIGLRHLTNTRVFNSCIEACTETCEAVPLLS